MKERPILFSAPMVRALLAGAKTQTRRIVKPQPPIGHAWSGWCVTSTHRADEGKATWATGTGPFLRDVHRVACPYGQPGDRLWCRESLKYVDHDPVRGDDAHLHCFAADIPPGKTSANPYQCHYFTEFDGSNLPRKSIPSIFMPRRCCRLTLEITGVRVERLQSISEADAIAEGVERHLDGWYPYGIRTILTTLVGGVEVPAQFCRTARDSYRMLWESINGAGSWDANPWVWVVEFKLVGNGGVA